MVDVTDITTGAINGTGYFDKFMAAMNAQIDSQFVAGRIQSKDAATVYLGALQLAMQQAVAYATVVQQISASQTQVAEGTVKHAHELEIYLSKLYTEQAQTRNTMSKPASLNGGVELSQGAVAGEIGKKNEVLTAQKNGYARLAEQKAAKVIMDAWSISKSSAPGAIVDPAILGELKTNTVLESLAASANLNT